MALEPFAERLCIPQWQTSNIVYNYYEQNNFATLNSKLCATPPYSALRSGCEVCRVVALAGTMAAAYHLEALRKQRVLDRAAELASWRNKKEQARVLLAAICLLIPVIFVRKFRKIHRQVTIITTTTTRSSSPSGLGITLLRAQLLQTLRNAEPLPPVLTLLILLALLPAPQYRAFTLLAVAPKATSHLCVKVVVGCVAATPVLAHVRQ